MDVLLAIGDPDLLVALQILLREEPGVTVIAAVQKATSLLALAEVSCPDPIVLDWALPGHPATELSAKLHACERAPRLIAIGRHAQEKRDALAAGADAFVLTGSAPEQLLIALRSWPVTITYTA